MVTGDQPEQREGDAEVPLLTLDTDDDAYYLNHFGSESGKPQARHDGYLGWNDRLRSFERRTPLPLLQLVVLCAARLAEPITFTQIFPYINEMVEDLKVTDKPSEIGYYSGTVDSIFALCQLFTIFQWGRLSDRIGRKPVILFGLTGMAISSALFGMSKSLLWAIVSRSMAGALSGNVAAVQSAIGEITDETNQAQAFPLASLAWNLGCVLGPMIGGNFIHPAEFYPNTFGKLSLLKEYPYLLPCLVAAVMTVCVLILCVFFLKETLPPITREGLSLPSPASIYAPEKSKPKNISVRYIIASPIIRGVFKSYFLLSFLSCSFDVVFTLLAYTPVQYGGLSRTPEEIGYALACSGILGAVIQVLVFPALQRRFNSVPLYRSLMLLWAVAFGMLPLLNVLARRTAPLSTPAQARADNAWFPAGALVWTGIGVALALFRAASLSFSLNMILIKNAAPSQEALGSTFGLAQSVACVARAGAPALVSSLFAASKERQIFGGNFVWLVLFGIAVLGVWSTYQIRDGAVEHSHKKWEENEMSSF